MTPIDFLLRIAATWLLAYSFTALDGPGGVFHWLREFKSGRWHGRHGVEGVIVSNDPSIPQRIVKPTNGLLDCIVCFSAYVGLVVMLAPDGVLLQGFGVAGVAMLLHKYTGWSYSG